MAIYTKKGDTGETGLPGKRRLPKKEQLFEVLGNLDQTNASVGVALSIVTEDKILIDWLIKTQRLFLEIGAALASEKPTESRIINKLGAIAEEMEKQIDVWEGQIPELKNFILPGGSRGGAQLHFCRTLVRLTERSYHRLSNELVINEISLYLNRLSDFFFQAARCYNHAQKSDEEIWTQGKL